MASFLVSSFFISPRGNSNLLGLVCLVVVGLFHASLGLEVVIEDYVPLNKGRRNLIYAAKATLLVVGVASLWSLVVTAF